MDLTDKWLGKPVAALKAAFAKRMSLDVDGLSTKRADGTTISEALPIRDIIDGVEGSANVVFELVAGVSRFFASVFFCCFAFARSFA